MFLHQRNNRLSTEAEVLLFFVPIVYKHHSLSFLPLWLGSGATPLDGRWNIEGDQFPDGLSGDLFNQLLILALLFLSSVDASMDRAALSRFLRKAERTCSVKGMNVLASKYRLNILIESDMSEIYFVV